MQTLPPGGKRVNKHETMSWNYHNKPWHSNRIDHYAAREERRQPCIFWVVELLEHWGEQSKMNGDLRYTVICREDKIKWGYACLKKYWKDTYDGVIGNLKYDWWMKTSVGVTFLSILLCGFKFLCLRSRRTQEKGTQRDVQIGLWSPAQIVLRCPQCSFWSGVRNTLQVCWWEARI